jgi:hypothetical protein
MKNPLANRLRQSPPARFVPESAPAALPPSIDPSRPPSVRRRAAFRAASLLLLPALPFALAGQSSPVAEPSDEEVVVLSPFEVTAADNTGYLATTNLAGSRMQTEIRDVGAALSVVTASFLKDTTTAIPQLPVTVIKRADALVFQFALACTSDKAETRNAEINAAIEAISKAAQATPGLRFEPREVYLAGADRKKALVWKGGIVTSFAHFVIFADFSDQTRPYQRSKQVRDLLAGLKITSTSLKLVDGPVGLYLRRPNQYRGEILKSIFDDLEVVKKGVGAEFEVFASGLNGCVRMRTCSETDVELWIDYSFAIRSIRELEAKKCDKK